MAIEHDHPTSSERGGFLFHGIVEVIGGSVLSLADVVAKLSRSPEEGPSIDMLASGYDDPGDTIAA